MAFIFQYNVPREAFLVVAAYYLVQSYGGAGFAAAYLGSTILGLIFHFSLVAMLYRKERKELGLYAERELAYDDNIFENM